MLSMACSLGSKYGMTVLPRCCGEKAWWYQARVVVVTVNIAGAAVVTGGVVVVATDVHVVAVGLL